ncbi:hypothetical protein KY290_031140 [Solanum tuberosum]|uniref:Uncharacterized protein n=1 Tax=Solanum tuberosum TaxID=4113 RepID=A0ABQ7UA40_SOLTU|nr:hypothetical protein KY290_031140 [Solanum tuberosum]
MKSSRSEASLVSNSSGESREAAGSEQLPLPSYPSPLPFSTNEPGSAAPLCHSQPIPDRRSPPHIPDRHCSSRSRHHPNRCTASINNNNNRSQQQLIGGSSSAWVVAVANSDNNYKQREYTSKLTAVVTD